MVDLSSHFLCDRGWWHNKRERERRLYYTVPGSRREKAVDDDKIKKLSADRIVTNYIFEVFYANSGR